MSVINSLNHSQQGLSTNKTISVSAIFKRAESPLVNPNTHLTMQNHIYIGKFLPADLRESMLRYRHDTFVKKLGWQIPGASQELESDEFDRDDTVYILITNSYRQILGCARLLPTTHPYLLQRHFAHIYNGAPPVSHKIWELSRFAASSYDKNASSQSAGSALLAATLACASELGASQLIGITFSSIERLFRQFGASITRESPVQRIDGRAVVACRMDVDRSLATIEPEKSIKPSTGYVQRPIKVDVAPSDFA